MSLSMKGISTAGRAAIGVINQVKRTFLLHAARTVCAFQGDKSVSPSVKSPLNNSGGAASGGSVTPSSSASLKGFSKSALPPSLG